MAFLTKDADASYVNLLNPESQEDHSEYIFLRMLHSNGRTKVLLMPNAETFEQAINASVLTGRVDKDGYSTTVNIEGRKSKLDDFMDLQKLADRFHVEAPFVLTRIGSL